MVLRSLDGFSDIDVAGALRKLIALPNVRVEGEEEVVTALCWAEAGVDLADGLHLASRSESVSFVTFDARFAKRARKLAVPVSLI